MESSPTNLPGTIYVNPWFLMLIFVKYNTCFYLQFDSREEINCDLKKSLLTTFGSSLLALPCELSNSEPLTSLGLQKIYVLPQRSESGLKGFFCPIDLYSSSFLSHRTSSTLFQSTKVQVFLLQHIICFIWVKSGDTSGKKLSIPLWSI